jgi:hypothetical protein
MQSNLASHLVVIDCEDCQPTKESLMDLFFDLDFTENQEYYRKDTLKKGFKNEAERVIVELLKKDLPPTELIEACIEKQIESSGFYKEHYIRTHTIDDTGSGDLEKIIVSIAYTTES